MNRFLAGPILLLVSFAPVLPTVAAEKTSPERAFAELKLYDAQGHPWRAAQEDWAGAKRRVQEDAHWSAWLKRERTTVDAWAAHHQDHVEWAAGWSHDGVSPKDGSRVIWTDKIPRQDVTFLASPSDSQIEITDKLFAWWVVTFRGKHADMMVRAAELYRLTGDEHYATWAAGQMDLYADNLARWKMLPTAKGARLYWQTLTEASNLVKYADVVRLLEGYVVPERREHWRKAFFLPEVELLNATHHDIHNIATWQRCAVAQVALLFRDDAMWREALDGRYGLREQIAKGITGDSLWYEQSLGYNNFVVAAVRTLFTAAGIEGRAAELAAEMAATENLMLAPTYLRFPNGELPNPADSNGIPTAPNREVFADNYRIFPTVIGLTEAAQHRDWDSLLDPPPPAPGPVVLPVVASRNLEATRMALLVSGRWQVFLHYGQLARSHTQHEALNYSAFYGDTDITHDTGTVGYGSPLHKDYYTRGLNHNVPLVNGEGETPPQAGELLAYSAETATVSVAQPHYSAGASARRTLHIDGDALVDTATIESTQGPQSLGLALNVQGHARLPAAFTGDANFVQNRPSAFRYWRDVTGATFHDRAELGVVYGATTMHVVITAPGEFKLWHGSTPDVPPKRRESFYLELTTPATGATFTTTLKPTATAGGE